MNDRGQILLPGLALFFGVLILFFVLIVWGRRQLRQERMEMAAAAAALSAARAQAYLLTKCAAHNLEANFFVNLRYESYGAMEAAMVEPFEAWLYEQEVENNLQNFQSVLNGFKGYASGVGHQVARLNGAQDSHCLSNLDLRLKIKDLKVFIFYGYLPAPVPVTFFNVYYTRQWGYEERKAQPPHQVIWSVSDGALQATDAAQVFLDVPRDEGFQNGGFPRDQGEDERGNFEIQSFYPQFNAQLTAVPFTARVLSALWR